jgi:acyl-CoA thioesterase-1
MFRSLSLFLFILLLSPLHGNAAKVINAGIPGQTTAEIDERVEKELNAYSPNVVVVFAGMNDAVNDAKFLSPEASGLHLESIVRKCRQHGARVLLVTVHQPDIVRLMQRHSAKAYGDRTPEQRIRELNAVIQSVATKDHIPVVNFAQALEQHGGATTEWSTDGVHLTARGYALLADIVFERLQQTGGDIQSLLCLGDSLTFGIGVRQANAPESAETYPEDLLRLLQNTPSQ